MSAKEVLYDVDARERFGLGLDALANAVKVTLGPRGRNVVLDRGFGAPTITKDGVSVAREIELRDPIANMGAQMVKEVASKTSDLAGDGTTTATVLAQAIYAAGTALVAGGIDPMQLKRGIDAAVAVVVADLARQSTPTQGRGEIAQVGTISANGDATIGALIAEAMEKVGKEGVITLEEANATETTLDVVEGMQLDRGYLSPYFVTDPVRMEALLEDAYVLVHEKKISRMQSLLPLVEKVVQAEKSLLIVAEDIDGEALATLVVNKLRGTIRVCAVKAPGYGDARKETLNDVAVVTGGKAFMEELGLDLESATLADLGRVKKVIVERERTVLVGGAGDVADVAVRTRQLRARLEETEPGHERTGLETRLGKLAGGVAVIKVGAHSETEMKEKKDRVEDALHATRAAVEEGVVAGGGVALLRSLPALAALHFTDDARYGVDVIRRAIEAPLRQIAANCGVEGAVVVDEVRKGTGAFGFNGATGGYEDLVAAGIIDPTKVVRVALQNAASVASLMLTAQAVIAGRGDATGEGAS